MPIPKSLTVQVLVFFCPCFEWLKSDKTERQKTTGLADIGDVQLGTVVAQQWAAILRPQKGGVTQREQTRTETQHETPGYMVEHHLGTVFLEVLWVKYSQMSFNSDVITETYWNILTRQLETTGRVNASQSITKPRRAGLRIRLHNVHAQVLHVAWMHLNAGWNTWNILKPTYKNGQSSCESRIMIYRNWWAGT